MEETTLPPPAQRVAAQLLLKTPPPDASMPTSSGILDFSLAVNPRLASPPFPSLSRVCHRPWLLPELVPSQDWREGSQEAGPWSYMVPSCVSFGPIIELLNSRVLSKHFSPACPKYGPPKK